MKKEANRITKKLQNYNNKAIALIPIEMFESDYKSERVINKR
jgi:hypothetical protein